MASLIGSTTLASRAGFRSAPRGVWSAQFGWHVNPSLPGEFTPECNTPRILLMAAWPNSSFKPKLNRSALELDLTQALGLTKEVSWQTKNSAP